MHVNVLNLIYEHENSNICCGIPKSESSTLHIVRLIRIDSLMQEEDTLPFQSILWNRHIDCDILCINDKCEKCLLYIHRTQKSLQRKNNKLLVLAAAKAPITITPPIRVKLALQNQKLKCKQLEEKISVMRESIEQSSVDVDDGLSKDFIDIFSKEESNDVSPFMNLWQQQ